MMTTGCPDCDKVQAQTGSPVQLCLKHMVEYLKWSAENAKKDYEKAKDQYEREQDESDKNPKS